MFDVKAASVPDEDQAEKELIKTVYGKMFRAGIFQKEEGSVLTIHSLSRILDENGEQASFNVGKSAAIESASVAIAKAPGRKHAKVEKI